jgi:hypothetical protein
VVNAYTLLVYVGFTPARFGFFVVAEVIQGDNV